MPKPPGRFVCVGSALGVVLIVAANGRVCPSVWTARPPEGPSRHPGPSPERRRPPLTLAACVPRAMLKRVAATDVAPVAHRAHEASPVVVGGGSAGRPDAPEGASDLERDAWRALGRRQAPARLVPPVARSVVGAPRDAATRTSISVHGPPRA